MDLRIKATSRKELGKAVGKLRRAHVLPAVLYGHGISTVPLAVGYAAFEKVYRAAGGSSLVDVEVDAKPPLKALIQDVQYDPVSGRFVHVDFHAVKMTEKISAQVVLRFVGESKAVKELGGILLKNLDQIKVECLPKDLVHEIPVEISKIATFDDAIRIRDLAIPSGIEVKEKAEDVVALVQRPRTEEELKELEEKPEEAVEEVGKVEKEKKEEEAPATAEAPPGPQVEKKEEK